MRAQRRPGARLAAPHHGFRIFVWRARVPRSTEDDGITL
jgi:hypothetical protein